MATTKADLVVPTDSSYLDYQDGEIIGAAIIDQNFIASRSFITTLTNFCIDQSPQLEVASTYTAVQNFTAGLTTTRVRDTSGSGEEDIVYLGTGSGTGNQIADQDYVDTQISAAGNLNLTLTFRPIQPASFNALSASVYWIDVTSGSIIATLPAAPVEGDAIRFVDYKETVTMTNTFTINGNGNNVQGEGDNQILTNFLDVTLIYDSTEGWYAS